MRTIFALFWLLVCVIILLSGCATSASRFIRSAEGDMIEVERLTLKGIGNRKAKFDNKAELECDSGFKVPSIKIEDLRAD